MRERELVCEREGCVSIRERDVGTRGGYGRVSGYGFISK